MKTLFEGGPKKGGRSLHNPLLRDFAEAKSNFTEKEKDLFTALAVFSEKEIKQKTEELQKILSGAIREEIAELETQIAVDRTKYVDSRINTVDNKIYSLVDRTLVIAGLIIALFGIAFQIFKYFYKR